VGNLFPLCANVKGAVRAFTSMIAGIVAGALMFVLSLAFGFTPWWAVPLAVIIMVIR
jgi:VIT1/CCC1 family predicted Fe2+/Mn2+ transporter